MTIDAGLAVQRTALAWQRTAAAAVTNAMLLAKVAASGGVGWRPTGAIPVCGVAVMLLVVFAALARSRSLRRGSRGPAAALLAATAVAVTAVAASITVLVIGACAHSPPSPQ